MNTTLLPDILHHTPAGASTHTILHYAQEKPTGGFHGYDWGSDKLNFQHHGGPVPEYNLRDVSTPVALYWSDNDYFAMPSVRQGIRVSISSSLLSRISSTLSVASPTLSQV